MGYWGWRQVCAAFVSVWVVGCSITHDAAPTLPPTRLPPVTLTMQVSQESSPSPTPFPPPATPRLSPTAIVYNVQPGDTLLGIAVQYGVELKDLQDANPPLDPVRLPIGQAIIIPNPHFDSQGIPVLPTPTPVALLLPSPTCYPIPTGEILCLGQIINNRDEAIDRVLLSVRLLQRDGDVLAEGNTSIEQGFIPAGRSAPYHILLKGDWQQYLGATVWLRSADIAQQGETHLATLDIREQPARIDDGKYLFYVTVRNPNSQTAQLIRAIATLQDPDGKITGYRVLPLSSRLNPGDEWTFQISVMSQTRTTTTHSLYIEAELQP